MKSDPHFPKSIGFQVLDPGHAAVQGQGVKTIREFNIKGHIIVEKNTLATRYSSAFCGSIPQKDIGPEIIPSILKFNRKSCLKPLKNSLVVVSHKPLSCFL